MHIQEETEEDINFSPPGPPQRKLTLSIIVLIAITFFIGLLLGFSLSIFYPTITKNTISTSTTKFQPAVEENVDQILQEKVDKILQKVDQILQEKVDKMVNKIVYKMEEKVEDKLVEEKVDKMVQKVVQKVVEKMGEKVEEKVGEKVVENKVEKKQNIVSKQNPEHEKYYTSYPVNKHMPLDQTLLANLKEYYKDKKASSIADFGCGICEIIDLIRNEGYETFGIEGNNQIKLPFIESRDLSRPLKLTKTFDYVQSFEVGEHISCIYEDIFIQNIVKHARKGIVMSWAIEGQGGYKHINTKNNDYIIRRVEKHKFKFNETASQWFRAKETNHFKNTIMVFDKV